MSDRPRVLIVDDEEPIRLVLADILDSDGYAVQTVSNGREALECLASWRPDVILLDLMMPTITGRTFRDAQLRLGPDLDTIPLVVLSGSRDARQCAIEMHADAVIMKPFDIDEVTRTVQRLLLARSDRAGSVGP